MQLVRVLVCRHAWWRGNLTGTRWRGSGLSGHLVLRLLLVGAAFQVLLRQGNHLDGCNALHSSWNLQALASKRYSFVVRGVSCWCSSAAAEGDAQCVLTRGALS